jgi:nickel-type superoxide dismutase maturation protease
MDMQPPSDGPTPETYHRGRKSFMRKGAGVVVAAGVAWACLRWKPSRVIVEGGSMAPALAPGDWALTVPLHRPRVGDVVVVEHPGRAGYEMVKRVIGAPGERVADRILGPDEWWIEGDVAQASTDSRQFGPVRRDALRAKVVSVYWPKGRRHRV